MPTSLTFDDHLAVLESSAGRLLDLALEAGMDAPVPTCPTWEVRALLAHQTMVHRWATAHVTGTDPDLVPNQTEFRTTEADLPGRFREGYTALASVLRAAAADLEAMTFLNDAPRPREFWARRQAHETAIHMVDALAAARGRVPTTGEVGLDALVAVDGLDELLCGFFTRGRSKLYDGVEYTVAVVPDDVSARWVLHVGPSLTVDAGDAATGASAADATITGSAAGLYLALWNRGDDAEAHGRHDVLERWHATQRVRWS